MPGTATSDAGSAQTRSRISGLDSASECEARIRRELISVSDLCGGVDEIQDLLDEITLLGEAGSGGEFELELDRPGSQLTQRTWDSHQQQVPRPLLTPGQGVLCLCHPRRLLAPLPVTEAALALCSMLSLLCVAVSGDPLRLPAAPHTRLSVACCVLSLLWTLLALLGQLSGLQLLLPLNPALLHRFVFGLVCMAQTTAAVLLSHQSLLYQRHLPVLSERARTATTLAAVCCWLGAVCALAVALLPRCLPAAARPLLSAPPTGSTLASAGEDWIYRHPEPEPEPLPPPDPGHNPYIEWHVRNGNFHLLPDSVRYQLTAVT